MKTIKIIIVLLITVISLQSCKNYEEGPDITVNTGLNSQENRILGEWELDFIVYQHNKIDRSGASQDFEFLSSYFNEDIDLKNCYYGGISLGWKISNTEDLIVGGLVYKILDISNTNLVIERLNFKYYYSKIN